MFTGIIEETGTIEAIERNAHGTRLTVRATECARGLKLGDSVAVNGCCLTVAHLRRVRGASRVEFDLLEETWRRTNLQFSKIGAVVNLERALRASDRLGGHFVTGHVDDLGTIVKWEQAGADWLLEIKVPKKLIRHMVFKGSVAVDGISLTVAAVMKSAFRIWIIPHTYTHTALHERSVGDAVNIETDILGKYVERLCGRQVPETK